MAFKEGPTWPGKVYHAVVATGELRELRKIRRLYLDLLVDYAGQKHAFERSLLNAAYPPVQVLYKRNAEEFDSLTRKYAGQQEKVHQMTLTIARLQARLDSISGIASRAKPR